MDPRLIAPRLATARLTLRVPELDDAEALSEGSGTLAVARWTERIPHPNPPEAVRAHVEAVRASGALVWVIDDGTPAGMIGLDPDLGYWVAPRAQGRGYAVEAAAALLAAAFAAAAGPIAAQVMPGNAPSRRVLARLGFRETGARSRGPVAATGGTAERLALTLTAEAFRAAAPGLALTGEARSGISAA